MLALWSVVGAFLVLAPVTAQTNSDNDPARVVNPDLPLGCGTDFNLIIDRSGSINSQTGGAGAGQVQTASQALVDALAGTGSEVQIVSFSSTATTHPGGVEAGDDVIGNMRFDRVEGLTIPNFGSAGFTNWDDGFEMVRRSPAGIAPLTIFVTDGRPTARNNTIGSDATPGDGHGTGFDIGTETSGGEGPGALTNELEIDEAVREANALKAAGSHIFVVAVGTGLSSVPDQDRIRAVSGDDQLVVDSEGNPVPGGPSFGEADFTLITDFALLTAAFRGFVKELCSPSLNITKLLIPVGGTVADAAPSAGWQFDATVTPTPSSWQDPTGTTGATGTAVTDAGGIAQFKWEPATTFGDSTVTVTEAPQPGLAIAGVVCEIENFDGTDRVVVYDSLNGTDPLSATWDLDLTFEQGAFCTVYNQEIAPGSIAVVKTANPTEIPEPGGSVDFTVAVTNTSDVVGDTNLQTTIESLTDVPFGDITAVQGAITATDCALPQTLDQDATYTCTFTATVIGDTTTPAIDTVTASGVDENGNPVEATDDASVTFTDVLPDIEILKTASPTEVPETGGDVTFTFDVTNPSVEPVTITSLTDSDFGDLNGQGTCATGAILAANGGTYSCSITETLSSPDLIQHENTATVIGVDNEGNQATASDDEVVTFSDVLPAIDLVKTVSPTEVPETGGDVTYTYVITNTTAEPVTITGLVDDRIADLVGCVFPQPLAAAGEPGDSYTCSVDRRVVSTGPGPLVNLATATGVDDDGNQVTASDDATVTFTDVLPGIAIEKTANPTQVPETGGDVEFTFEISNTTAEPLTLESLVDDKFGDLNGQGDCSVPQSLDPVGEPGDSYTCSITQTLSGPAGSVHENTATATGTDDEGNPVEASDNALVGFDDEPPAIDVTKTADPTEVPETGGEVTFTFEVTNETAEPVTIISLTDSVFGDLDGQGDCSVPQPLAAAGSPDDTYTCSITVTLSDDDLVPHVNTVTAVAVDDDDNEVTEEDDETVTFTDVLPVIQVVKTANPTEVPETGGDVTFTFEVSNLSLEAITLDSMVDDIFGDLNGQGDCSVPQPLAPAGEVGDSYTCSIERVMRANADVVHRNVVTVAGSDNDGNVANAEDDATVEFGDVPPEIDTTKTADTDVVPPQGGLVAFTVDIENLSLESVFVTAITDEIDGQVYDVTTIAGPILATTCELGVEIAVGDTYSCAFTVNIEGDPGEIVSDTVLATVVDDDGTPADDDDPEDVPISDEVADLAIEKTASALQVGEPGTYTLLVTNLGPADAVNVVVDDDLPQYVTLGTTNAPGWDCSTSTTSRAVCTRPLLAAGESSTIVLNVNVADPVPVAQVTNVVTVDSETFDPDPSNNRDEVTTVLINVLPQTTQPLAFTGANVGLRVMIALAFIVAGAAFVLAGRREDLLRGVEG